MGSSGRSVWPTPALWRFGAREGGCGRKLLDVSAAGTKSGSYAGFATALQTLQSVALPIQTLSVLSSQLFLRLGLTFVEAGVVQVNQ